MRVRILDGLKWGASNSSTISFKIILIVSVACSGSSPAGLLLTATIGLIFIQVVFIFFHLWSSLRGGSTTPCESELCLSPARKALWHAPSTTAALDEGSHIEIRVTRSCSHVGIGVIFSFCFRSASSAITVSIVWRASSAAHMGATDVYASAESGKSD